MFVLKHMWYRLNVPMQWDTKFWAKWTLIDSALVFAIYGLEHLILGS